MVKGIVETLAKTSYFAKLDKVLLSEVVSSGALVHAKKGKILIKQGAKENNHFFILLDGQLSVYRDDLFITTLNKPGQVIGEMAVLSGHLRSAQVIADKPSKLLKLSAQFLKAPSSFNFEYMRGLNQVLIERLGSTTKKTKHYEHALLEAKKNSFTDSLTTLFNRRYYDKFIKDQITKSKIQGIKCSVILTDVDHFKQYNDTYGHPAGDRALKTVAKVMKESVRKSDMPARYGGEEFVIVLPSTSKTIALRIAEKIRAEISLSHVTTVSLGVATYPEDGITPKELLQKADQALYTAKKKGRNCVMGAKTKK